MTRLDEVRAMTRDQLMEALECAETGRDHDRMKRKEAEAQVKELEAECVKGREELRRMDEYEERLQAQISEMREVIDQALIWKKAREYCIEWGSKTPEDTENAPNGNFVFWDACDSLFDFLAA